MDVEADLKHQQLKVLQETIRNLQTQLLDNKAKEKENLMRINHLEDQVKRANVKELLLKTKILGASKESLGSDDESNDSDKDVVFVNDSQSAAQFTKAVKLDSNKNIVDTDFQVVSVDEVRLIGLLSSYLNVHPFGVSLEHIRQYIQQACSESDAGTDIESILQRHTNIFTRTSRDKPDAPHDAKWTFCGFHGN